MYQVIRSSSGKFVVIETVCMIATAEKQTAFFNRVDAENFADYLQNGLKVVLQRGGSYYFNSGEKLIDITSAKDSERKFILHTRNGRSMTAEKTLRKYIELVMN